MSGAKADAILSRSGSEDPSGSEARTRKKVKKRKHRIEAEVIGQGTGLVIADEDAAVDAWAKKDDEEDVPGMYRS